MLYLSVITVLFTYLINLTTAIPAPIPVGPITRLSTYLILNATISRPWSSIHGTNPENLTLTVVGDWPGAIPVQCSLRWDAGIASVTVEDVYTVNVEYPAFVCSDQGVTADMTRIRVEPWFLWEIRLQAMYAKSCFSCGTSCCYNIKLSMVALLFDARALTAGFVVGSSRPFGGQRICMKPRDGRPGIMRPNGSSMAGLEGMLSVVLRLGQFMIVCEKTPVYQIDQ